MQNIKYRKQVNYFKTGFTVSFIIHLLFVILALHMKKQSAQAKREVVLEFNVTNIIKTGEYETDTMKTAEEMESEWAVPALAEQEIKNNTLNEEIPEKPEKDVSEETAEPEKIYPEKKMTSDDTVPEKSVVVPEEKMLSERAEQETKVMTHKKPVVNPLDVTQKIKHPVVDTKRKDEGTVTSQKSEQSGGIVKSDEMLHELKQSAKNQYIRENFDYINKVIRINISYPYKARKMSMQGDVILSFIVWLDGSVQDIRINKSSGYPILDNNAKEAVRKASPFPLPPVEVKIVIPITYKLNT